MDTGYRIDPSSPTMVSATMPLFTLRSPVRIIPYPDFESEDFISDDSRTHGERRAASLQVSGCRMGFQAAAEANLESRNQSEYRCIRADQNRYAIKYHVVNDVPDFSTILRPEVVSFVRNNTADAIVRRFGHFYAQRVELGGHLHVSRIIESESSDSAVSMTASISASFNGVVGSASLTGGFDSFSETSLVRRAQNVSIRVLGGNPQVFLRMTEATAQSCIDTWANSIEDTELYPLKMDLFPIWEAFSGHSQLRTKANQIETYIRRGWQQAFASIPSSPRPVRSTPKSRVMARLDEWDICSLGNGRYYIVLPGERRYLRTARLTTAEALTSRSLVSSLTTLWNQNPGHVKIAGSSSNEKVYCLLTNTSQYIRVPSLRTSMESSRNRCHSGWQIRDADHVLSALVGGDDNRFYAIRGNRYYGTRHMRNQAGWNNTLHPDFSANAVKYWATNNRFYAVYWDDNLNKLCYRCTTNMHTNANHYNRIFNDLIMREIPGFRESARL